MVGYRASLFHIGVLARLAELDALRYVEGIVCFRGLHYRSLLLPGGAGVTGAKPDREITAADYVAIVADVERDFLAAVQKNLRTRVFLGWLANLRSLVQPRYTRTDYLGQLLERYFYSKPFGKTRAHLARNELRVNPKQDSESFNPKLDNGVAAKAPILLLNATSLNTGHNWQFAVSWMENRRLGQRRCRS